VPRCSLSALALGRVDVAERWLERLVESGHRDRLDPAMVRALAPLHHTDAWKALTR
jgi:hypothetical protein